MFAVSEVLCFFFFAFVLFSPATATERGNILGLQKGRFPGAT
ncbi:secreted protein [Rhodopirellula maiorica SM1]|uniref:Secreted protein n=1 Tax=Rhodopirellula maiorica SM1 TaxID=1265738 RepID=M5RYV0_9BACT|nr:secreted protein [Rhodopirellula maiorica SM1]